MHHGKVLGSYALRNAPHARETSPATDRSARPPGNVLTANSPCWHRAARGGRRMPNWRDSALARYGPAPSNPPRPSGSAPDQYRPKNSHTAGTASLSRETRR
jgi:hypothetical protein